MTAVQGGPTSIRVTWTPPSPLGDSTGYIISFTSDSNSTGSENIDGGQTDTYTLTGLNNGETYTVSVAGTAQNKVPSSAIEAMPVALCRLATLNVLII